VIKVAGAASTEGKVRVIQPTMGGEDFSFIAEQVPSVFLALGQVKQRSIKYSREAKFM